MLLCANTVMSDRYCSRHLPHRLRPHQPREHSNRHSQSNRLRSLKGWTVRLGRRRRNLKLRQVASDRGPIIPPHALNLGFKVIERGWGEFFIAPRKGRLCSILSYLKERVTKFGIRNSNRHYLDHTGCVQLRTRSRSHRRRRGCLASWEERLKHYASVRSEASWQPTV